MGGGPPGSAGVPPAFTPAACPSVSPRWGARPPCRRDRHGLGRSGILANKFAVGLAGPSVLILRWAESHNRVSCVTSAGSHRRCICWRKNPCHPQCRGSGENGVAVVEEGQLRERLLQAILIEQRSCGSGSPAGRTWWNLRRFAFGSQGGRVLGAVVATRR